MTVLSSDINKNDAAQQLIEMGIIDQKVASGQMEDKEDSDSYFKKHAKHLKDLIEIYGWPKISEMGKDASKAAWLIAQHADQDIAFQELCLSLMQQLYSSSPQEVERHHIALLIDRVLVNKKKPQIFGTQYFLNKDNTISFFPTKNPENVDLRRKEYMLPPLADYEKYIYSVMRNNS